MSASSLIQMTEAAFERSYFHNGQGFFSPRTGKETERGTGYAVNVAKPLVSDTDQGRGTAFVELVGFVSEHFTDAWATEHPRFLLVTSAPIFMHTAIYCSVEVINDRREAFLLAEKNGATTVWDFNQDCMIDVPSKSHAAVDFTDYPAVDVGGENMVYQGGKYVSVAEEAAAVLLHDIPSLSDNPWKV